MKKGIILYSGGLDSLLAAKLLMEQNIELKGIHFVLPFVPPDYSLKELKSSRLADSIGLSLKYWRCDHDYMEIIRNPPHGYGKYMNPCIDCKIFFLNKAKL